MATSPGANTDQTIPPESPRASRRDFLAKSLLLPAAAAAAYMGGAPAFNWAAAPATEAAQANPLSERLHAEYAEECQVYWRYTAYAAQAKEDGYPNIARLFRAAAEAERIHAAALLFVMGAVKTTAENLKAGADYEAFLAQKVFPQSIEHARDGKDPAAAEVLRKFREASMVHQQVFTHGLEALQTGADMADVPILVCPVCGAVILGKAHDSCPVCRTARAMFQETR
jgi:rubrerythrin